MKDQRISRGKDPLHLPFEVRMGQFDESYEQGRVSGPLPCSDLIISSLPGWKSWQVDAGPLSMKT